MVTIILAVILASTLCVENDGFDLEIDDSEDEEEPEETPDLNCMD